MESSFEQDEHLLTSFHFKNTHNLVLYHFIQDTFMASLPAVVTQDEVIDLTMGNKDNEHMDESLDTMAITAHQSIENLDSQKSTNKKKLVQQDLHKFLIGPKSIPKKRLSPLPKRKRSLQKTFFQKACWQHNHDSDI